MVRSLAKAQVLKNPRCGPAPGPLGCQGSALFEMAILMPVIVGLIAGALIFVYLRFTQMWMDYQGHAALFCMADRQPASTCLWHFHRKMRPFLPFGHLENVRLQKRGSDLHFQSEWHTLLMHKRHHLKTQLTEKLKYE